VPAEQALSPLEKAASEPAKNTESIKEKVSANVEKSKEHLETVDEAKQQMR